MKSIDLRLAAVRVYEQLGSLRKTARLLGVSKSSVHRWHTNGCEPRTRSLRPARVLSGAIITCVRAYVSTHPFVTCTQLRHLILELTGVRLSRQLAAVAIRKAGLSRMRARNKAVPSVQRRDDRIRTFRDSIEGVAIEDMLFVDEVGFRDNVVPLYGYAKRGTRLRVLSQSGGWKHASVAVAIDCHGVVLYEQQVAAFNTASFLEFIQRLPLRTGQVIVMDNVRFHHSEEVQLYLAEKGVRIAFTPPYEPDFNPIENVFSTVKHHYRYLRATSPCTDYKLHIAQAFTHIRESLTLSVIEHAAQCVWRSG